MNHLATAIQSLGLTGTAAEIRTALQAEVEIYRNATPHTWAGVNAYLLAAGVSPEAIDALGDVLPTVVGGKALSRSLESGGVDFTLTAIRDGLDSAAGSLGQGGVQLVAVLKSIGLRFAPRWQAAGLESLPSEAEITEALAELAELAEQEARYQSVLTFWNRISRDHDLGELSAENYEAAKAELA